MNVAIDIGGTFTDIILYEKNCGIFWSANIPSDPDNPEIPFIEGLVQVLELAGKTIKEVDDSGKGTMPLLATVIDEKKKENIIDIKKVSTTDK